MHRPHQTQERVSAEVARRRAALRAARAGALARRRAAARRRAGITMSLVVLAVAGWSVAGLIGWSVAFGAVPSVLLAAVLVLGRRAAIAGARADAEWERQLRELAGPPHPAAAVQPVTAPARPAASDAVPTPASAPVRRSHRLVQGRAVHPSDADTEVIARVTTEVTTTAAPDGGVQVETGTARHASNGAEATAAVERTATKGSGLTWSPVPVPAPTYTLKPAAPPREPAPLSPEQVVSAAARREQVSRPVTGAADEAPAAAEPSGVAEPTAAQSAPAAESATPALDLDVILQRRRASGE